MSVLIFTGVSAAYLYSVGVTLTGGGEVFYEAAAMLITFVLFGHWMEMRSRRGTTDALRALLTLVSERGLVVRDGQDIEVDPATLEGIHYRAIPSDAVLLFTSGPFRPGPENGRLVYYPDVLSLGRGCGCGAPLGVPER